jgi:putative aldouronate transport system permease protein
VAYPLYFVIIASFSNPEKVARGLVLFAPEGFTFEGYKMVFEKKEVMRGFFNSIYYAVLGTVISLAVTLPTAYALSRDEFYGRKIISYYYIVTMFISGGLVPTYLIIKQVGFIDSVWALVIPGAIGVGNIMVGRTFFRTNIPYEFYEAARIDGCNQTRFFLTIALPLSAALIAILVLWIGVGHWNSYFSALLYINKRERQTLQLELRYILLQDMIRPTILEDTMEAKRQAEHLRQVAEMMKYSLIIVSSLPVMILYPFIQKHFVKGVTVGSLKG